MNELAKMKYKSFTFPSNPSEIKILGNRNIRTEPLFGASACVSNVSADPTVIKGSGAFFGNEGGKHAHMLHNLLKEEDSGWLFAPCAIPVQAFFEAFTSEYNAAKNCVSYTFSFIEDCTPYKSQFDFGFTYARDGENAFDIAGRTGVSVDKIMESNSFVTPFDINKWDKVALK